MPMTAKGVCVELDGGVPCVRPVLSKGLCSPHYQKKRHENKDLGPCVEGGCPKPGSLKGRCPRHYHIWRKARKPGEDGARMCRLKGCGDVEYAVERCLKHYNRRLKKQKRAAAQVAAEAVVGVQVASVRAEAVAVNNLVVHQ